MLGQHTTPWLVQGSDGTHNTPAGDAAARARYHIITDGTNSAAVKAANTGATTSDPALVTRPFLPTDGTHTTPAADAVGRALFVTPTDGTNQAAFKAASTASVATDTSEVVQCSPNGPNCGDVTATGTITAQNTNATGTPTAGSAVQITLNGQSVLSVQTEGTWTASGGLSLYCTNDGSLWVNLSQSGAIFMQAGVITASNPGTTIASGSDNIYVADLFGYSKCEVTAGGAVTGAATLYLRASYAPQPIHVDSVVLGSAASNLVGDMGVGYRATTTNAGTIAKVNSAASTNATSTKASAGRVIGYHLCKTTAGFAYFRLYNKASAPTVGTDSPAEIAPIAGSSCITRSFEGGVGYATGIAYAITAGATDLDSTAVAAQDVVGYFIYQ